MDLPPEIIRSFCRSGLRDECVRALARHGGRAYPAALARELGVTIWELHQIMHGYEKRYRHDLAPVTLGLAELRRADRGNEYVLTRRGWVIAGEPSPRKPRTGAPVRKEVRWT